MVVQAQFSLQALVRPNIWALKPYRCARDDYSSGILLDANENSFGHCLLSSATSSPSLSQTYATAHLERYPDPHQQSIKSLIASFRNLSSADGLFLGVGSDESLDLIVRVFCAPGREKILICPPTYGMYSVCAQVNDVEVASVPLDPKFQLDVEGIQASVDADPTIKVLFLCSPGNPTGTLLNPNDVRSLLEHPRIRTGSIVVVDEAYVDFCPAGSSLAAWVDEYPNLVVTQTLSKSFGLAGIRLGISISSPDIARVFNSTKAPYNISTPTSILASAALAPEGVRGMQGHVASILEGRNALLQGLQDLKEEGLGVGAVIGGNDANFVLVPILDPEGKGPDNDRAFRAYKTMAEERGVVVRFRGSEPGCEGCLRITVGTPDENKVVLETLRKLLQG